MATKLFEHNQKSYDAAVDILSDIGTAVIVHPANIGKVLYRF